jgi:hypothetical protein
VKARVLFLLMTLTAALGLGGCFTSDAPLFTDDQAAAPYAKITFARYSAQDDMTTATRTGKAYVTKYDVGSMTLRFMALGDDLYLTESASDVGGKIQLLYAVVRLDATKTKAMAYKVMAHEGDLRPGLSHCGHGEMICIEDVDAYVALAKAAIAAGEEPDTTYSVMFE